MGERICAFDCGAVPQNETGNYSFFTQAPERYDGLLAKVEVAFIRDGDLRLDEQWEFSVVLPQDAWHLVLPERPGRLLVRYQEAESEG